MDNLPEKRFPVGAAVNRRTGKLELQYQSGDDQAFSGVLLPLLKVGQLVLGHEEGSTQSDLKAGDNG